VPAEVVTSDDGLLTVGIPAGALPAAVTLTATAHGVSDLPPELFGLQVRDAFYEISPVDVELAAPIQVTRKVSYRAIGVDPETDGTPVLTLALRTVGGSWKWLESQKLATDGQFVTVSGWTSETGSVFAFGGTTYVVSDWSDEDFAMPVGSGSTLTVSLSYPTGMAEPPVLGPLVANVDGTVVVLGSTSSGPEGNSYGQEFRCAAEGQADVGATATMSNVGADSVLFQHLGLDPLTVELLADATLTCGSAPPPGSAAPS